MDGSISGSGNAKPKRTTAGEAEVQIARLQKFYGVNYFQIPGWYAELLFAALPVLQAEELLHAFTMNRAAQAKDKDYKALHKTLTQASKPARARREVEIITISPASEGWFKREGIPYQLAEGHP